MKIDKRVQGFFVLGFTLFLSACEGEVEPVAAVEEKKSVMLSDEPKPVAVKELTAEEKEIEKLLAEGKSSIEKLKRARRATADFHYRVARNLFSGSLDLPISNPARVTDLNKARQHLSKALDYVPGDPKTWKLFLKIDSYLGQPESIDATTAKKANEKLRAERQQKAMEFRLKLAAAEKLQAEGKLDQAIREYEKLRRQLED
jgi:hypothetical protein